MKETIAEIAEIAERERERESEAGDAMKSVYWGAYVYRCRHIVEYDPQRYCGRPSHALYQSNRMAPITQTAPP